ncbi:MAG: hypothetical protein KJ747_03220 [Actinobacteria bacterium]|nr:hypothetical protein [Actinomycetota bacterium]MCG2807287.1 hypothetical protein [Coriobacteriia bacterium]
MRISANLQRLAAVFVASALAVFVGIGVAKAANSQVLIAGDAVVALGGRLSEEVEAPPVLSATTESWSEARVAEILGSTLETVAVSGDGQDSVAGRSMRLKQGGMVRLDMPSGGFYFAGDSPAGQAPVSATADASATVGAARRYVVAHGGMPTDAELWGIRDVVALELSLSDTEADVNRSEGAGRKCIARYVEFRHTVGGVQIDGPDGGDCIKVRIDAAGLVNAYGRTWTAVGTPSESVGSAPKAVRAREALRRAIVGGGPGKGRLAGRVDLRNAQMVYVRRSVGPNRSSLVPAWRFVVNAGQGDQKLFVDARSGAVIDSEQGQ